MSERSDANVNTIVRREVLRHPGRLILLTLAVLMGTWVTMANPLLFRDVVDKAIPQKDMGMVLRLIGLIALLPVLSVGLTAIQDYYRSLIGQVVTQSLRVALFKHLMRVQLSELETLSDSDISYRVINCAGNVGDVYIAQRFLLLVINVFLLVSTVVVMGALNAYLFLVVLLSFAILYGVSTRVKGVSHALNEKQRILVEEGQRHVRQVIPGMRTVRAFNQQAGEVEKWEDWSARHIMARVRAIVVNTLFVSFPFEIISSVLLALIFGCGAYLAVQERISVGDMVAYSLYVPRALLAVRSIVYTGIAAASVKTDIKAIDEILALPVENPAIADLPPSEETEPQPERSASDRLPPVIVRFDAVSFSRERGNFQLHNLTIDIREGEFVGIVGDSGGGKSTMADLLMGFYPDYEGRIDVDGRDIRTIPVEGLRATVCVVPQNPFLWDGTLLANVTYGSPDASQAEVEDALRRSHLQEFIQNQQEQLDTVITNNGATLSGGERQRIAICRALLRLRRARVVVMDEPSSALDPLTEARIRQSIESLRGKRTVIVISHRLSTVANADTILVVRDGRIVEAGAPAVLLQAKGHYYDFYVSQKI